MKESKIEAQCRRLAILTGWVVYKGLDGAGAPDRIFLKDGRGFTVEFKRDKYSKLREAQVTERVRLTKCGVPYYVCWSLDDFKEILITEETKLCR